MVDYTDTALKGMIDDLTVRVTAVEAKTATQDSKNTEQDKAISDLDYRVGVLEEGTPEPPVPPEPEPDFKWPDASNTGVPDGTTLTPFSGSKTIAVAGTVVEAKDIPDMLTIDAANVVVKKCKVGQVLSTSTRATGLIVEDCDIVGTGQLCGIEGKGTFRRNDIRGFQNGGRPSGVFAITKNWIHEPKTTTTDPHYDGLEIYSKTTDGLVEDNVIEYDDTSCVFVSNLWGSQDNIRVNHNKLTGADVLARFEGNKSSAPVTNCSFTNNVCGPSYWAQLDIQQCDPVVTGNTDLNGNPLSKAHLTTNQANTLAMQQALAVRVKRADKPVVKPAQ